MQLYLSAFLLDQTETGVILALRTTAVSSRGVHDNTFFLSPSEQISCGRTISDLAFCDLAYADFYQARRTVPLEPDDFMTIREAARHIRNTLDWAQHVYVPDETTWLAVRHMLPLTLHYNFPIVQILSNLDFFTPQEDMYEHAHQLRRVA